MIRVHDLSVVYRQEGRPVAALDRVSFELDRGDSLCIIGPSGCGKTTLMYVLAGLLAPTAGSVEVGGQDPRRGRAATSLILQDYGLLPWKRVWDNVALGLQLRHYPPGEVARRTRAVLETMGLWEFRRAFPAALSGGQRQRVAIARSLATQPDVLLMDEPFSALDALTRENMQDLVRQIWQHDGLTMVLVTHSIEEAVFLGRHILVMSPRPGRPVAFIDNPEMTMDAYRQHPVFHQRCSAVRQLFYVQNGHTRAQAG